MAGNPGLSVLLAEAIWPRKATCRYYRTGPSPSRARARPRGPVPHTHRSVRGPRHSCPRRAAARRGCRGDRIQHDCADGWTPLTVFLSTWIMIWWVVGGVAYIAVLALAVALCQTLTIDPPTPHAEGNPVPGSDHLRTRHTEPVRRPHDVPKQGVSDVPKPETARSHHERTRSRSTALITAAISRWRTTPTRGHRR